MTIDPPTATDFTSKPNNCKKGLPRNQNNIIKPPEIRVTLRD
jgi:hypothetical protein